MKKKLNIFCVLMLVLMAFFGVMPTVFSPSFHTKDVRYVLVWEVYCFQMFMSILLVQFFIQMINSIILKWSFV